MNKKTKAIELRKKGMSYGQIQKQIKVAKSTLSLWCKDVSLSKEQRVLLMSRTGQVKGVLAIQKIYWTRRKEAFDRGVVLYRQNNKDTVFVAGIMLYWAEGKKKGSVTISNSDPSLIHFMVNWFVKYFKIARDELVVHLHIHAGQDEKKMKQYWSTLTKIPIENFQKSFTKPEGTGHRGKILYNGTANVRLKKIGSAYALYTIYGALAAFLEDVQGKKVNQMDWLSKNKYM